MTGQHSPGTNVRTSEITDPAKLKAFVRTVAEDAGLDAFGVTDPDGIGASGAYLRRFLSEGQHAEMSWMETTADRRADPRALWPGVKSIVMVGLSYAPDSDPLEALAAQERGVVSCYAKGWDYHDILKGKLKHVARQLVTASGRDAKYFVDTAPVMEKPLAAAAGLGWQGKHTNLVSREHGSWLFLGAIFTAAEMPPDMRESNHCGTCSRCIDVCPTAAIPQPYQLDPRRCLAYLSIEHRSHIDRAFRVPMGNRVFGCDDCLAVCPWNKFAGTARDMRLRARAETDNPPLADLLTLDDAAFRLRFAGTPVKRTGRDRFVRNVLIASGNSGDEALYPQVEALAADPSPLVRAMAAWAAPRLGPQERVAQLRTGRLAVETDEHVRSEWTFEERVP